MQAHWPTTKFECILKVVGGWLEDSGWLFFSSNGTGEKSEHKAVVEWMNGPARYLQRIATNTSIGWEEFELFLERWNSFRG